MNNFDLFGAVLNFVLFQKYEKYDIKYRTKICDFTVYQTGGLNAQCKRLIRIFLKVSDKE